VYAKQSSRTKGIELITKKSRRPKGWGYFTIIRSTCSITDKVTRNWKKAAASVGIPNW